MMTAPPTLSLSPLPLLQRQQQGNTTPTVLLIVLAIVTLSAIGYLGFHFFNALLSSNPVQEGPVFTSKPLSTAALAVTEKTDISDDTNGEVKPAASSVLIINLNDPISPGFDNKSIPDPKAIVNAKIPDSESLAKEEIDRLEDEKQRLAVQEKLAKEQVQLIAKINQQKAAQIALLEKQIAELEKDKATAKP